VADLLECVLQIKGLRETLARVQARAGTVREQPAATPAVTAQLRLLLAAEARWQAFLAATLGEPARRRLEQAARGLPEDAGHDRQEEPGPGELVGAFTRARLATLCLLDNASADDLAAAGDLAGRGRTTVADCVALMLAHDTDRLGDMPRATSRSADGRG
jgi:hypothetical protein